MLVAESPTVNEPTPANREQLEGEAELERQFRELFEHATDLIYIHDLEGNYTAINPSGLKILGYAPDEAARLTSSQVLAPEYRELARRMLDRQLDEGGVTTYEVECLAKGGSRIPFEVCTSLIFRKSEPIGVQGIARDISDRRRAEQLLREKDELLRNVIDTDPNLISVKDRDGRFVLVNRAAAQFNGRTVEEMIGKLESEINPDAGQLEKARREDTEIIDLRQEKVEREEALTSRIGQTFWLQTIKRPLMSPDGKARLVLGVSMDISERKRTEEALTQAKVAAETDSLAKSEFLANMSHEIRTPMNGVLGMTQLLLDTELTPEQRDYAETVRVSAEGLLTIINDILEFSKMDAGKLRFETVDFDLREVVDRSLAVLAEPAARKGLEIGALIPHQLNCSLRGDPGRLRQVLLNLAGNAVKFTEKGEVFLSVSLEVETEADVKLRFDISDTGIGIEPGILNRLFQPFSQADETTARRYGGTGLGLAICKRIVNQMRGEVGVHSRQGAGSTFWLTARFQKQASGQSLVCKESKCPRSFRALVVDDNEVTRLILSHYLLAWEIETVAVSSTAEARNLLRQQADGGRPFDVVMLDMEMPQSAGFTESIQTEERLGRPRMIMLTSYSRDEGTKILRRKGNEACLIKPIKRTDLHRCLANVIATDVIPDGSRKTPTAPPARPSAVPVRPLRILLAEDNAVNQKVALWQLEKLGYKADVVATGHQALQALQRVAYDVVLMDGRMPEMDGYEATRRLRANGHTVHIIAMTASAMQGDRDTCLKAGMDDYICKPVRLDELKTVLERVPASTIPARTA